MSGTGHKTHISSSQQQHLTAPGQTLAAAPALPQQAGPGAANTAPELRRLLAEAEAISRAGFPVLPIKRNSKRPKTAGGKNDATTNLQHLIEMIKASDNIGIAWPRGVLGIDIDVPKDAAREPLPGAREHADGVAADLEERFRELRNAPRLRTRSEGLLYIVELPVGTTMPSTVAALPGIDLRGDGRTYTLVEPSVINGRRYEWERPLVPRAELPIASPDLLDYLSPSTPDSESTRKNADLATEGSAARRTIEGDPASYAQGLLKNTHKRLSHEKSGRNTACYGEALTLGRWVGAYDQANLPGLTFENASTTLIDAMKDNGDYGDDPRKAENTIQRGLEKGMASAYVIDAAPRLRRCARTA